MKQLPCTIIRQTFDIFPDENYIRGSSHCSLLPSPLEKERKREREREREREEGGKRSTRFMDKRAAADGVIASNFARDSP